MDIGILFCGGCRPRYDMNKAHAKIEQAFRSKRDVNISMAMDGGIYDHLVVVGGCEKCCPGIVNYNVRGHIYKMTDIGHVSRIISSLRHDAAGETEESLQNMQDDHGEKTANALQTARKDDGNPFHHPGIIKAIEDAERRAAIAEEKRKEAERRIAAAAEQKEAAERRAAAAAEQKEAAVKAEERQRRELKRMAV